MEGLKGGLRLLTGQFRKPFRASKHSRIKTVLKPLNYIISKDVSKPHSKIYFQGFNITETIQISFTHYYVYSITMEFYLQLKSIIHKYQEKYLPNSFSYSKIQLVIQLPNLMQLPNKPTSVE